MGTVTLGHWMNETSGELRPAVMAYLHHDPLSDADISAMRAYLRQWVSVEGSWMYGDPAVEPLRAKIDRLTSIEAINEWMNEAIELGIDPL
jgi:hypothetical protein